MSRVPCRPYVALLVRPARLVAGALLLASPALAAPPAPQGTRLNAPVVPGGRVDRWVIAADASRVFYGAFQASLGTFEIHDVPLDGSQTTRALSAPFLPGRSVLNFAPFQVSPDETRLVYIADHDTDEKRELYSVPTDGSRVATNLSGTMPATADVLDALWTPNGTRVVFRATPSGFTGLFSVVADGSSPRVALHPNPVSASIPFVVTPDSSRVAFVAGSSLRSAPVDGSAASVLLSDLPPIEVVSAIDVTPDGEYAVFVGGYWWIDPIWEEQLARGLYAAPVDDSAPARELVAPVELPNPLGETANRYAITSDSENAVHLDLLSHELHSARLDVIAPAVLLNPPGTVVHEFALSPNGRTVVLTASVGVGGGRELYSVPVDRNVEPQALTSVASITSVFRPQVGKQGLAVFTGTQAGVLALYSVRIDGGHAPVELSGPMTAGGGVQDLSLPTLQSHFIGPDGGFVLYAADQDTDGTTELYCSPVHGRRPGQKVSAPLVLGGDVRGMSFVPGSRHVVYNADQDTDGSFELFLSAYGDIDFPAPSAASRATRSTGTPGSATVTVP